MYIYRHAVAADIVELIELLKELTAVEEDFDFDAQKQRCGLEQLLHVANNKAVVVVAEFNGEVVGMCSGQVVVSTAMGAEAVWVEDVVVKAEHRGRGVGKMILEYLQEWGVTVAGAKRMQLCADRDNVSALGFYEKQGWIQTNFMQLQKLV